MTETPTLKVGWTLGEPPVCSCGRTSSGPTAYLDEGWCLFWGCEYCGPAMNSDNNEIEIAWPFGKDDMATPFDLEAIGFEIA